jgi:hypothetical protein
MSVDWTGSPNLHIGRAQHARPRHVAAFDPLTGRLTALREGRITLAVTVAGVTRRTGIPVVAVAAGRAA